MVEERSISQGGFSGLAIGISQGFQGGLGCSVQHLHQDTVVSVCMHSVSLVRELEEDKNLYYDQEKRLKNNCQWTLPVVKLGTCREMFFHTREELCCIKKAAFAWCNTVGALHRQCRSCSQVPHQWDAVFKEEITDCGYI